MDTERESLDRKGILKQALLKIDELQARLSKAEDRPHEPIAIIGAGCRLPGGADDLDSFWQMLIQGKDAVGEIPPDRWDVEAYFDPDPQAVGKMYTRRGAFLSQVDQFDAQFFKIAPREAAQLDPQQRLLLEVCWEALEMAGQASEEIVGSATGIYIGMTTNDYATLQSRSASTDYIDTYFGTGVANSVAAGRIAYVMGLRGPCMTVDTACSSSLVALHLACQSLHAGESQMALAGGVSLILAPDSHIIACKGQMLSPDGRCKTFDAAADGYGRGEGCAMVVLKRLSDAQNDGDHILGLILGSAINQDGKSAGLTAPSGIAQVEVMRTALKNARIAPEEVAFIETHGTGTVLGDPIEMQALGEVYGAGHSQETPLWVGSVKTNVGHLEAAAGITGLVKILLAMRHEQIPPHLHLKTPNPYIPWKALPIKVVTSPMAWPEGRSRLVAGLSSFGFSGTNAHIILQNPPAAERTTAARRPWHLLTLSAKTSGALGDLAASYLRYLDRHASDPVDDLCFTANTGRSHFNCRLGVIGRTATELRQGLQSFKQGRPDKSSFHGEIASKNPPPIAFLFTGQGSQAVDMGRRLFETQPVFRAALERCHDGLRPHLAKPLLDVLYPSPANEAEARALVNQTGFTQALLFAVEYALCEVWKSWGIEPSAVMGHSVGEYVAACVAGVFSVEDGLRLIATRGRLMQGLPMDGAMAAVFADAEKTAALIRPLGESVCIASINSPENTVIAGPKKDLSTALSKFEAEGIKSQKLFVSHAFHSPLMEQMLPDFKAVTDTVHYAEPQIDFVSNVNARLFTGKDIPNSDYWCRHVRKPVQFMKSMQTLYDLGHRLFVEVGPHPTLLGMAAQCLPNADCLWAPSLRRGQDDWEQMLKALGLLYCNGAKVRWRDFEAKGRRLPLPNYPFQRERHWIESIDRSPVSPPEDEGRHPLLGRRVHLAKCADTVFESTIDAHRIAFVQDHRFYDVVIVPATAYLEMAQAAAAEIAGSGPHWIEDFNIHAPLVVEGDARITLQTIVTDDGADEAGFEIHSFNASDKAAQNQWRRHASGRLILNRDPREKAVLQEWPAYRNQLKTRCAEALSRSKYYEMLHSKGVDYGPAFQGLEEIYQGDGEALGRIHIPVEIENESGTYHVHPAILDTCLQILGVALLGQGGPEGGGAVYMPMGLERYSFHRQAFQNAWIHGTIRSGERAERETFVGDIQVYGADGLELAQLKGIRFKRAAQQAIKQTGQEEIAQWLHRLQWRDLGAEISDFQGSPSTGKWIIFSDHQGVGEALAAQLREFPLECLLVRPNDVALHRLQGGDACDGSHQADFGRFLSDMGAGDQRPVEGIVDLSALSLPKPDASESQRKACADFGCIRLLSLVQALSNQPGNYSPRLVLATRGATDCGVQSEADDINPLQSAIWGLGRVIASEHPEFGCKLVDLDPTVGEKEQSRTLAREIAQRDYRENQIALRGGRRFGLRLIRAHDSRRTTATQLDPAAKQSYQLETSGRGVLDNLELKPAKPVPPGPGEVQIQIEATGLNFRDVLNALGMYPGDPGALGNECVGRIAKLGSGVQDVEIGDPVLALTPQAFCSHVTVGRELMVARPENMSVEEAATVPITFITAQYALHHLGHMRSGDRVLIHAGAGGVGMAAIQLAQQAGAEIFATAGSEEKRALLKELGVHHVMNSRTLDFADQIGEATAHGGIDIVLNSLAGDFIPKSLSLLREGGRFLELGKTDLWDQERAAQVNRAATFIPVFLGDICQRQPELVQSMFKDIMQGFAAGRLKPLPYRRFPIQEVREAFRFMAQAKHIGKVVVDQRNAEQFGATIHADACYLITGGLGALGLQFAGWLAEKGARHLVLFGRRPPGEAAQKTIARLMASGADVVVAHGDVSSKEDVQRLFDAIAARPKLRGVIHAAGLVDDALLRNQDAKRFIRVMAPKTIGSLLLHDATRNCDLDFFVLCSAGAALFGSPGQGNYVAANAFMDAMAHYRRRLGLPALSINWGPWAKGGMAAGLTRRDHERWTAMGMTMINPDHGLKALEMAMELEDPQMAVLPISWPRFFRQFAVGEEPILLMDIARGEREQVHVERRVSSSEPFLDRLEKTDSEDRYDFLMDHVRALLVSVLGLQPSAVIKRHEGLTDLGMDSLMAVEFSNRLNQSLNQHLPSTLAFEYPTIQALTDYLAAEVVKIVMQKSTASAGDTAAADQTRMRESVKGLDEKSVADLLTKELDIAGY